MARLFVGIPLPDDIRRRLAGLQTGVAGARWVAPENLHVTVKFLGDVKESVIEDIRKCVETTASKFSPFVMGLSHIGFYPSSDKPRVIWLSSDGGEDQLLDMFQELENCLEYLGIDRDSRTFSPHLTIGRVKRHRMIAIPDILPEFEHVSFKVTGLSLIKSTLTPEGPRYENMCEGELKVY